MGTPAHAGSDEISCIRCHGSVGHLELFATNVAEREVTSMAEQRLPRQGPAAGAVARSSSWPRSRWSATAALTALLVNIMERKQEAKNPFFRVVELDDDTEDPAVWGKNFPLQYDAYLRTVDQQRTRYGGSEALPRTPTEADPRSVVAQSRLEEDPRLKTMWAGYAFSVDFRKKRGHAYMLEDQTFTERVQEFKQPGTCIHCHALGLRALQEGRRRRPDQGLRALQPDAVHGGAQALHAPDRLHRLPRPPDDGAARDAARASSRASGR